MSSRKPPAGDFRKILEPLFQHGIRRVFDAFVRLAACALAAQTREPEYLEEVKHWKKEELEVFAQTLGALVNEMEIHPFEDIIGKYYMEFALSAKGRQWNGESTRPNPFATSWPE
jgi:hypothetical protein